MSNLVVHRVLWKLIIAFAALPVSKLLAANSATGNEFFEQRIRPILVEHCYECHSEKSVKVKGGLKVDSRESLRKGGETGAVIVPGKPDQSLLIQAMRYEELQMPPKGKLPEAVLKDFAEWVRMGAPDPRLDNPKATSTESSWAEALKQRRTWWGFQPLRSVTNPTVRPDRNWSRAIDDRIDADLRTAKLEPAPQADRRVLARRLSFAITGLPPSMDEVAQFEADRDSDAVARYVDRLLASPQFGERWARHWMDVVRYCETHGSEFDNHIPYAWRYRDYLVRAFNQDLPFDQLVREHIAGDLLPEPRWHAGFNESLQALPFWRFVEFYQTPVDVKKEEGIVRDSEIDALTKAFQGLTVSCARCHDHKFDPISQRDYYALYGILASSRIAVRQLDDPQSILKHVPELQARKRALREQLAAAWSQQLPLWPEQMAHAVTTLKAQSSTKLKPEELAALPQLTQAVLKASDEKHRSWLTAWLPLLKISDDPGAFAKEWSELAKRSQAVGWDSIPTQSQPIGWDSSVTRFQSNNPSNSNVTLLALGLSKPESSDVATPTSVGTPTLAWRVDGIGMPRTPLTQPGDFGVFGQGPQIIRSIHERGLHSDGLSDRIGGSFRTAAFTLTHDVVSVLARGDGNSRLRLVIENHQGDHLLFASVNPNLNAVTSLRWFRLPLRAQWRGLQAHVEIMTRDDKPNLTQLKDASVLEKSDGRSSFGIARVVMHPNSDNPSEAPTVPSDMFATEAHSIQEVAERWAQRTNEAIGRWTADKATDADARWLNGCLEAGVFGNTVAAGSNPQMPTRSVSAGPNTKLENPSPTIRVSKDSLQTALDHYRQVENQIPVARRICGLIDDGFATNTPLFPRGDHRRAAEPVARRYLEVLGSDAKAYRQNASGRLQLANEIASPQNPLTARVYVNRVWHWIFGRGLVSTVDNFGRLGEPPSHPELLDELAQEFMQRQWSTKQLVRALVLTATFQRSSDVLASTHEQDPGNRSWSHADVHRLDAESLRDSFLKVAGNLDLKSGGPSVPIHHRQVVDPDKQPPSGPIDGGGRRTLYLEVRRNFLSDFLVTFDFPKPTAPTGRRSETNVPAQNLALLNDPFVRHQADLWAKRLIQQEPQSQRRIELLYQQALQRGATPDERTRLLEFLGSTNSPAEELAAWTEAALVIFNTKEFLYLR